MKKKALYLLPESMCDRIYSPGQQSQFAELLDFVRPRPLEAAPYATDDELAEAEIVFGGWGSPAFDAALLARMPRLEAVFYGAGSIKHITPEPFWERAITITSSFAANGVPVAEFTEAQIIFALKKVWQHARLLRATRRWHNEGIPGAYGARVGLISLGMIGRLVAQRLQSHELEVVAYDPYVDQARADALGLQVRMVSLEELFATSDVVSLHAPNLPATRGMVSRALLESLKPDATFINTARGAIVDEAALCEILAVRPDLLAIIDVTFPEPPAAESPLFSLPNVVLTPHIAGSIGSECHRMGQIALDECQRYLKGEKLQWQISREMAAIMA